MKICNSCKIEKNENDFSVYSGKFLVICKKCKNENNRAYKKTKDGLISVLYSNQKQNSKQRGYKLPTYTKQELKEWLYAQEKFHLLYDNWKRLDFQKDYSPSIDRKDDYIGYTIANIQLVTFKENRLKYYDDLNNGVNTKALVKVKQFDLKGNFIKTYNSIKQASSETDAQSSKIVEVCKGRRNKAGGYKWSYEND